MEQHGELLVTHPLDLLFIRVTGRELRKGERTTHLVVNAFLQGFRAVDTGESISGITICFRGLTHPPACQPKHYRYTSIYLWGNNILDLTFASHREDLVGDALDVLQKKHDIKREEIYIQTKCTFDLLQRLCPVEYLHVICNAGSRQSGDKTSANRFPTTSRKLSRTKLQRLYECRCVTFERLTSTLISFIHL